MGSRALAEEYNEFEDQPAKCFPRLETHREIVELLAPLGPATPAADRENGDFPIHPESPLTLVSNSKPLPLSRFYEDPLASASVNEGCSPRTPTHGVFDPFAPGPDDLAFAPRSHKYLCDSGGSVARCLYFHSSIPVVEDEQRSLSEKELRQAFYENLFEFIISKHAEDVLAQLSSTKWSSDDCSTPPFASPLTGVGETCPGAPLKRPGKSRSIDPGLCRKLKF